MNVWCVRIRLDDVQPFGAARNVIESFISSALKDGIEQVSINSWEVLNGDVQDVNISMLMLHLPTTASVDRRMNRTIRHSSLHMHAQMYVTRRKDVAIINVRYLVIQLLVLHADSLARSDPVHAGQLFNGQDAAKTVKICRHVTLFAISNSIVADTDAIERVTTVHVTYVQSNSTSHASVASILRHAPVVHLASSLTPTIHPACPSHARLHAPALSTVAITSARKFVIHCHANHVNVNHRRPLPIFINNRHNPVHAAR